MRKRPTGIGLAIRALLIGGAVVWWSLLLNICSNAPQLDIGGGRTIPFKCPVTGVVFMTAGQRSLLYGLVPFCFALVIVDLGVRKRRPDRDR